MEQQERKLGIWEKYLYVWVILCILAGTLLGRAYPQLAEYLALLEVAHISIPIAICLFAMIYPIMVQICFDDVKRALLTPKPIATTLFMNWAIKPFTMAFFAWLFLTVVFAPYLPQGSTLTPLGEIPLIQQYVAGLILLGVAPCTAMVLVWSYLAKGNMAHTLVMTAINSLTMVVLYAPLATVLIGVSGIQVPWMTIALAVLIYICTPLVAGWITRDQAIKRKGMDWFECRCCPALGKISIIALLVTLIVLFTYQGETIVELPAIIGMITVGIFVNILVVFAITYLIAKPIKLGYEDAAPTAIIAGSNHFEVAIAVATTLFGLNSGAALATVVGVLTEVPIMLFLVWLCKRTRGFFG
ncbi:MAG TPA: ACR3 family arsenite efflux transporter [Methanomicrobia archaeon]|nr:ACR3 family arsenite efflux transporter [Methanomicrobia archaeon]